MKLQFSISEEAPDATIAGHLGGGNKVRMIRRRGKMTIASLYTSEGANDCMEYGMRAMERA